MNSTIKNGIIAGIVSLVVALGVVLGLGGTPSFSADNSGVPVKVLGLDGGVVGHTEPLRASSGPPVPACSVVDTVLTCEGSGASFQWAAPQLQILNDGGLGDSGASQGLVTVNDAGRLSYFPLPPSLYLHYVAITDAGQLTTATAALFAPLTAGVTVTSGSTGVIATLTYTPQTTGRFSVVASAGPGIGADSGTANIAVVWNTHGSGYSGGSLISAVAMNTSFALQGTGLAGTATGLTVGTSYDFYVIVSPSGADYVTKTPALPGGISIQEE